MDINTFREKSKVVVTDELIRLVVEGYLNSDMPFYNSKVSLMTCFELDQDNTGKVDKEAARSFVNEIMLNNLFDKNGGKENYMNKSEDERLNAGREESKKIEEMINKSPKTVYSTKGILPKLDGATLEHEFIINVKPEDFIDVLSNLYRELRDRNLDGIRIITPATRYISTGYHAPIKIKCSSRDLAGTLDFLSAVEDKIKAKTKPVLPILGATNEWYGYQQYEMNGVSSSSKFCSAIYDAIYQAVNVYIEQDDLYIDETTTMSDYLTNAKNKFVAMREIIRKSLEYNNDLMASIIEVTKNRFFDYNVNMVDCLRLPSVESELDKIYGKITKAEDLFNQREEALNIETPVKVTYATQEVSEEEKYLDNLLETSNVQTPVVEEVSVASVPYTMEVSENEKHLDDLLQNVLGHNNTQEELLKEVEASEPLVLGEDFVPGQSEDPAINSLIENIDKVKSTIETLENDNVPAKVKPQIIVNAPASVTSVMTAGGHKIDYDALKDSLTKEFVNDADVLIPDLSVVPGDGTLDDILRIGGYWNDVVYKRGLAEHFGITDYRESPEQDALILDNLRHLERFNRDGSRVDGVQPQVQVSVESQVAKQTNEENVSNIAFNNGPVVETEEVKSLDGDKVEVTTPESYKTVAAEKFGVDDYSKVPEQARGLIDKIAQQQAEEQAVQPQAQEVVEVDKDSIDKFMQHEVAAVSNEILTQANQSSEEPIKEIIARDKEINRHNEFLNHEEIHSLISSLGYQSNTSTKEEEKTPANDSLYVPDLSQVPGNDLKEALRNGGCFTEDEYLQQLATHFNLGKYENTPEQDEILLAKLRGEEVVASAPEVQQTEQVQPVSQVEQVPVQPQEQITKEEALPAEAKEKYIGLVSSESLLDKEVKGQNYTVAHYFERYNILDYIKPESKVVMHDQAKEITAAQFMSMYFIFYLVNYGADEPKKIIDSYVEKIKEPRQKKRIRN